MPLLTSLSYSWVTVNAPYFDSILANFTYLFRFLLRDSFAILLRLFLLILYTNNFQSIGIFQSLVSSGLYPSSKIDGTFIIRLSPLQSDGSYA